MHDFLAGAIFVAMVLGPCVVATLNGGHRSEESGSDAEESRDRASV